MNTLLTPKELAAVIGISTKVLRRCERAWGLRRVPLATRSVRYCRTVALKALRERGIIGPEVH